jgi:hypothetical protein
VIGDREAVCLYRWGQDCLIDDGREPAVSLVPADGAQVTVGPVWVGREV